MLLLTPLLLTLSILEVSPTPDYYWRRFYGQVPFDAVVAARTDDNNIYIGRAPFEVKGLLVGPITSCSRNVTVTSRSKYNTNTVHYPHEFSEILCSPLPHNSFKWVRVNSDTVSNQEGLVEGGYESIGKGINSSVLYIGRIKHDKKTVKIGKIAAFYHNNEDKFNFFYYADGQRERVKDFFEVLIYEDLNAPTDKMYQSYFRNVWPLDYYWRKYTGEVPHDAFIAIDEPRTYIGRAPLKDTDFLVGAIVEGVENIIVTGTTKAEHGAIHHVDKFVEILCIPTPSRFSWVSTTAEDVLSESGLVEGGYQYMGGGKIGVLYIGRKLDATSPIGKVIGYEKIEQDLNKLYYFNNWEESASHYEVLTYSEL